MSSKHSRQSKLPPNRDELQREIARRDFRYFIPWASSKRITPEHLAPAIDRLQNFETTPFEFVFSVAPRHGKTELILHFIVWALIRNPSLNICYVTYSSQAAEEKSRRALAIADSAGLKLTARSMNRWATAQNEHVIWTGVGGPVTGKGFDVCVVDDPVKNRAEAESMPYRERAWDFYQSDLATRLEPGGSFVCVQTRWHSDNLAGRLTKDDADEDFEGLDYVNVPAILDEGTEDERALWPERWSLALLEKRRRRVGEYAWSSLFMGRPRPRGATVFGDPSFFSALPVHFKAGQGLDLAFTEKKTADWSAVVTMLLVRLRNPGTGEVTEHFYVRRVVRRQKQAPDFKRDLRNERNKFPQARIRWYASGTESGVAQFLVKPEHVQGGRALPGITNLQVLPPKGDKFTRAIPFAAAWNEGRVLVPAPELVEANPAEFGWVNDFLDELRAFTGVKDAHDDQVDAAVAAFDVLNTTGTDLNPLRPEQLAALRSRM